MRAGLRYIEWAGDVHVPPEDLANAYQVGVQTRRAGVEVCSYGSYYRLCRGEDFSPVLDAAQALNAPNIRVWAGDRAPHEADDAYFAQATHELGIICDLAAKGQLSVSLEYHRWTLSQTPEGVLRLLSAVNRPNLFTYWQPNPELTATENVAQLQIVSPHLSSLHIFHWTADNTRLPLSMGGEVWRRYLSVAGKDRPLLLEFVAGDSAEQLCDDAATLKQWEELL
ncbi:MAG: TIM barrel protein [Pseudoflavonifractor sp.]